METKSKRRVNIKHTFVKNTETSLHWDDCVAPFSAESESGRPQCCA